jgi:uncharacterized protein YbjT (DUF2867 family)
MRIFLAGASGRIGARLLPLMVADGHEVAAMTRTPAKLGELREAGATPIVCDVFDRDALVAAVRAFRPDLVMHQLTDLPDDFARLSEFLPANARIRGEGTANLLAAAGGARVVAQSIAWPGGPAVEAHEQAVLAANGTVLRYGQWYGPGTFYEAGPPPEGPAIHVDAAARATMDFLNGPPGVFTIVDPDAEDPA